MGGCGSARAAGHEELVPKVVEAAANPDAAMLGAIGRAVDGLLAGQLVPAEKVDAKSFAAVARMWTSGELTRLYPDQVPEKRTAGLDVCRLEVLGRIVGRVPVASFTVDDAE